MLKVGDLFDAVGGIVGNKIRKGKEESLSLVLFYERKCPICKRKVDKQ